MTEPVAWRAYQGGYIHTSRPEIADQWGDGAEPLYPASALTALQEENERLTNDVHVVKQAYYTQQARVSELEARLAEAVKVVGPFAKIGTNMSHFKQRAFLQFLICPLGEDDPDDYLPYFLAALAFIERGKP